MAALPHSVDGRDLVPVDRSLEIGALRGVVAYRWLTLSWAVVAVFFQRQHLSRTGLAVATLGVAGAFTVWSTLAARKDAAWLMRPATVITEAAIGAGTLLVDGVVWGALEDETRRQSLPWAWPHAAIFTAALLFGMRPAIVVATLLAACSWWGELNVRGGEDSWVGVGSKSALYFLAAIGVALVMERLREASTRISAARAREEMARTLHDGVLQTLAVIQRRSDDTELVELARRQDADLRGYLWGRDAPDELSDTIAAAAQRAREGYGIAVDLLMPDDLPPLADPVRHALAGAVGEAITNAAKHADASRITVFAEPIDDDPDGHTVYVSVNDDGRGFDPATAAGEGIRRSIRGRIADAAGRVTITSSPTNGADVQVWVGGRTEPEDTDG
ncbi:MAG: hypothetical protein R8F63_17080 [Acidimicrobiales bacterium]|nr:hypothetical protein [Acidimicrobiales bacterium]